MRINKCGIFIVFLLALIILYYITSGSDSKSSSFTANKSPDEVNLRKLLIASIVAAQKGGLEVVAVSKNPDFGTQSKGKTKEGLNDPVTDADFRSHCLMEQGLRNIFSKLRVVSEEDNDDRKCPETPLFNLDPTVLHESAKLPDVAVPASDLTVWIDPLDATTEFTEKLFHFVTTMVCVAYNGIPIIGVIHNPFTDKTTWAWVDKAFSEDLAKVKKEDETKNPVVVISRSHPGEVKDLAMEVFGETAQVLPAAGAGYKVLQVVFNNATAYLHRTHIKKWDLCAGNAILNSLGGRMTDFQGKALTYLDEKQHYTHKTGILATFSTTNHEQYVEKLKDKNLGEAN